jgi:hypothetical protein
VSGPFEVENGRIGGLTDVVLDKIGTVTTEKLALTDVVPLGIVARGGGAAAGGGSRASEV